jgi:hypothetical protein
MEDTKELAATPPSGHYEITTAGSAAAAKAMIESRYYMALKNPRDWDDVRVQVLKECKRPAFAKNKSAFYHKPIGRGVEGLGIRFVEVALRCMKNVLVEIPMIHEDERKEVFRVTVTDLESNITYPMDVKITKTVERSKPSEDGSYISVRKNSRGNDVYTIPANDDDILNKRLALISKAIRTLGLRIIPGDIQDEAEEMILRIRKDAAAEDPDGERKAICDGFASLGVRPSDLSAYLGHDIGSCSPAELVELRGLYGAIKDGEATWKTTMENKARTEANTGDALDLTEDKDKKKPDNDDQGPVNKEPLPESLREVLPEGPVKDTFSLDPKQEQTEEEDEPEKTIPCPNREGVSMRILFCDKDCPSRKGCPSFADVDTQEGNTERREPEF